MRSLGFLLLAACAGGEDDGWPLESAAVESAEIDVLNGSGAQQRFRVTLADATGADLAHEGIDFVLVARATDPEGRDTPGIFSIDLTVDTEVTSQGELVTPGTQEVVVPTIAAGTCSPGCTTEVDLTWVHTEGGDALVVVEARAEGHVDSAERELIFDVELVF